MPDFSPQCIPLFDMPIILPILDGFERLLLHLKAIYPWNLFHPSHLRHSLALWINVVFYVMASSLAPIISPSFQCHWILSIASCLSSLLAPFGIYSSNASLSVSKHLSIGWRSGELSGCDTKRIPSYKGCPARCCLARVCALLLFSIRYISVFGWALETAQ